MRLCALSLTAQNASLAITMPVDSSAASFCSPTLFFNVTISAAWRASSSACNRAVPFSEIISSACNEAFPFSDKISAAWRASVGQQLGYVQVTVERVRDGVRRCVCDASQEKSDGCIPRGGEMCRMNTTYQQGHLLRFDGAVGMQGHVADFNRPTCPEMM